MTASTGAEVVGADAFERIVAEVAAPLGRFVAQMIRDRALAEDVLQEALCAAWSSRQRMPADPRTRRAWLFGVARNHALHALRRERRGRRVLDALAAEPAPADVPAAAFAMRDALVRTLGPEDRSLFLLRYVHGFSAAELAAMTGRRPATVRKRLERAASAMRVAVDTPPGTLAQTGSTHAPSSVA